MQFVIIITHRTLLIFAGTYILFTVVDRTWMREKEKENECLEKHPKYVRITKNADEYYIKLCVCVYHTFMHVVHNTLVYVLPLQISVRIECSIKLATHSNNDIYRFM